MLRAISAIAFLALLTSCASLPRSDYGDSRAPHWGKGAVVTGGTVRGGGSD